MFGRHLVPVQLDRLAAIQSKKQPTAAAEERGVRHTEQRDAGLLILHPQHHARAEVGEQRTGQRLLRAGSGGDEPQTEVRLAVDQQLERRREFAEDGQLGYHQHQVGARLPRVTAIDLVDLVPRVPRDTLQHGTPIDVVRRVDGGTLVRGTLVDLGAQVIGGLLQRRRVRRVNHAFQVW